MLSVFCAIKAMPKKPANTGKTRFAVVNWPSCLLPLCQKESSWEMCLAFRLIITDANQIYFHMKPLARGLVFKQRH